MDTKIIKGLSVLLIIMSILVLVINGKRIEAVNQANDLQAETEELNDNIATLTDAVAEYTETIEEYENEIATLNDALTESQEEVEELKQELATEETTEEEEEDVEVYGASKDETAFYELTDDPTNEPINDPIIPEEPATLEEPAPEPEPESVEESSTDESTEGYTYLGVYQFTAYEETGHNCANGNYPTVGYTVACNSLPLGTVIYIEGYGIRVVEDRGASWHSSNWMDLYLGDYNSCMQFGTQSLNVYLVE